MQCSPAGSLGRPGSGATRGGGEGSDCLGGFPTDRPAWWTRPVVAYPDASTSPFAGELFRTLAEEGRLVLDAGRADEAIADLERVLTEVRARLRVIQRWRQAPTPRIGQLPAEPAAELVDAVFADQLAPGWWETVAEEIPKYIEALRRARRPPPPTGPLH